MLTRVPVLTRYGYLPPREFGTYYVDPLTGSDRASGEEDAPLASITELANRAQNMQLSPTTAGRPFIVNIMNDIPADDVPDWRFSALSPQSLLLFTGELGRVAVHTGTITAVQSIAGTMGGVTDDYWIEDSAIPVSWTASGLLAEGLIFERTNGTACWWFAALDLGAKRLRVSVPFSTSEITLAPGDTYTVYRLPRVRSMKGLGILPRAEFDLLAPEDAISGRWMTSEPLTAGTVRRCAFVSPARVAGSTFISNCKLVSNASGTAAPLTFTGAYTGLLQAGLVKGGVAGTTVLQYALGAFPNHNGTPAFMLQNCAISFLHGGTADGFAFRMYGSNHPTACIEVGRNSRAMLRWVSGSGNNTSRLARIRGGNLVIYESLPPVGFNSSDLWWIGSTDVAQPSFGPNGYFSEPEQAGAILQT